MHFSSFLLALGFSFVLWTGACTHAKKPDNMPQSRVSEAVDAITVSQNETVNYPVSYLMGKFDPASEPGFVKVDARYSSDAGMYLRKETYAAFLKMYAAARKDGVILKIISATRNFDYQKGIWEAKWNGSKKVEGQNLSQTIADPEKRALKILEFSAMPGSSRHHWGTDMDLNDLSNDFFASGKGQKLYQWLRSHAAEYGFCQPYTEKGISRPNGYHEEKWHWSYTPLSSVLLHAYKEKIRNEMISGFKGAETAAQIGIVEKYALGVNSECY